MNMTVKKRKLLDTNRYTHSSTAPLLQKSNFDFFISKGIPAASGDRGLTREKRLLCYHFAISLGHFLFLNQPPGWLVPITPHSLDPEQEKVKTMIAQHRELTAGSSGRARGLGHACSSPATLDSARTPQAL